MSIPAALRPRFDAPTALWGLWLALVLAVNGFLGLIALSFLNPAPTAELTEVSQRLQEARRSAFAPDAAAALDGAASQLFAAQRAIALERGKAWRLRSYDRARGLIAQAERALAAARIDADAERHPIAPRQRPAP